jgi:hypothetical protein
MFALLFLIGQALVYSSEAIAVRYARCGRALDLTTHRDRYPRAGPAGLRGGTHLPAGTGRLPRQQVMAQDNAATPAASRPNVIAEAASGLSVRPDWPKARRGLLVRHDSVSGPAALRRNPDIRRLISIRACLLRLRPADKTGYQPRR